MTQIEIKKREKDISQSIFRLKSNIVIFVFFIIGVILYCLSYEPPFPYRPFTAYAAEPYTLTGSHSEGDLSSEKEREKIIKRYLKEARECYKEGEYHEAIKLWSDVLAFDPANQRAKEGIDMARRKVAKIRDFFGRDVFGEVREINRLSLSDCIKIAEESSLLFQIAKEQINLGKIKVWEARRSFLPSLIFSWSETKGIRSGGKIEGIEYGVEGKQPAFHSGELIYALAQSRANLKIAEENYDGVKLKLCFEVAEAYYALVSAKRFLEYTKGLYENVKPLYEMAQNKHKREVVSDIEYLNTESKFNQIYYRSISAESDFEIARLALEQKLNIERTGTIDVEVDILPRDVDKDLNLCLLLAIENRPDLKMGELTVKSAEYGKKIAQAKELPHVDLAGHYKRAAEVYKKDFAAPREEASLDPKRKWYAGLEVSWPFYGSTGTYSLYKREDPPTLSTYYGAAESKGTSWKLGVLDNVKQFSETKEAEIGRVRAEEELNEMRKKVIMEVKDAYYGYEKARVQLEAARVQKEFSQKETEILKVKHSLGETDLSDLFESFVRLMETNNTYFETEKDLNTSIAALNKAIGLEDYF